LYTIKSKLGGNKMNKRRKISIGLAIAMMVQFGGTLNGGMAIPPFSMVSISNTVSAANYVLRPSDITSSSITLDIVYPNENDFGNRLRWRVTGTNDFSWSDIEPVFYMKNGKHTINGLLPNTQYDIDLVYYDFDLRRYMDNIITVRTSDIATASDYFDGYNGGSTPSGWWVDGYNMWKATTTWEYSSGVNNSRCVSITANTENDVRWKKNYQLSPNEYYKISVDIKGENITGGKGATLGIADSWDTTMGLYDTFGWKKEVFYTKAPDSGLITLALRIGHNGAVSSGKVYFDNLTIEPMPKMINNSTYFRAAISKDLMNHITTDNMKKWMGRLDQSYEAYRELVGTAPFDGVKTDIMSTHKTPAWAYSGNPIKWNQDYIPEALQKINNEGDWSFGMLHEIGHNFDKSNWEFNAEFFANMKMMYVMDRLNAKVKLGNLTYTGNEIEKYYKTDSGYSFDKTIAQGKYHHDGLTYCFFRIKNRIGWEPFKRTFRHFTSTGENPDVTMKFDRFLALLQENYHPGGNEVTSTFLADELNLIRNNCYKPQDKYNQ
jgi:hypothetical protein